MRILADENLPKEITTWLRERGHDVSWAATDYSKWADKTLLEVAELESRILVTLDKDFLDLGLRAKRPLQNSGIVLFRVHPCNPITLRSLVELFVDGGDIWIGRVSIISRTGIQTIRAPRQS